MFPFGWGTPILLLKALTYYEDLRIFRGSMIIGFKEAKTMVLEALANNSFQHEARDEIDVKNLLQSGAVSSGFVSNLIKRSNGKDHSMSPHHSVKAVVVHVIKKNGWYVKFYFLDPDTFFISVHQ